MPLEHSQKNFRPSTPDFPQKEISDIQKTLNEFVLTSF
jgi:hypothetical protein